ncbi:KRAB-A domain-containing protein 2-like [Leptopilina heterotoma]|uniref:KRAB-A domain-containing protein 2-like n=1 Tax=Leptopilina heterotoma TaxID=63436 RepID=UPI001CA90B18|nr:KRAB-A domain-containing protein 2-like [Leptopilina heterotoma]
MELQNGSRSKWDKKQFEQVQLILSNEGEKTPAFYHISKTYEILRIGSECNIILKRSSGNNDLIYMVPIEDYYEKLTEAHYQTGHVGRDRMLYYMKKKWRIPRIACEIFISLCETCNLKKSVAKKGVVVKPIISHGFNARGQVDLIDFQSCPDGEYKWLMNYQDHATKFLHLRPIKS